MKLKSSDVDTVLEKAGRRKYVYSFLFWKRFCNAGCGDEFILLLDEASMYHLAE